MTTDRARSARGADAETPEAQAAAAARDSFVTYDELKAPGLDAARWSPARLPPDRRRAHSAGSERGFGRRRGRSASDGPGFSLSHDTFQPADSAEYLIFWTRQFELPLDRPATFAADLAVKNIAGQPEEFRRGMAAFQVSDFEVSKRVFAVCGTSTRVLALHEQLGLAEPVSRSIT